MLLALTETQWYVLAAIATAVAGIVSTIFAIRSSRKQTVEVERLRCEEQLRLARGEAERLAAELHAERMKT